MADHVHQFAPSGWCTKCTYRADGRYLQHGDVRARGRDDSPEFDSRAYLEYLKGLQP